LGSAAQLHPDAADRLIAHCRYDDGSTEFDYQLIDDDLAYLGTTTYDYVT